MVCVCGGRRRQESEQTEQSLEDVRGGFLFRLESTIFASSHPPGCYSHPALLNYCYSGTLSECLSDCRYFGTKHIWLRWQARLLGLIDRPTLQCNLLLFLSLWWQLHVGGRWSGVAGPLLPELDCLQPQDQSGWWSHEADWENLHLLFTKYTAGNKIVWFWGCCWFFKKCQTHNSVVMVCKMQWDTLHRLFSVISTIKYDKTTARVVKIGRPVAMVS